jgi:hypothetical protein
MDDRRTRSTVVDLLRYRLERAQTRLDFEGSAGPRRPALAPVSRFRPLTTGEIAHRRRMADFLGKSEVKSQKSKVSS